LSISLFAPVVPPHVFVLTETGATFASIARSVRPSVAAARRVGYGPMAGTSGLGSPVFSAETLVPVLAESRRLLGRVNRASVVFPDTWARTITLDFDALPPRPKDRAEMVAWKFKKLMPGRPEELDVVFSEIPKASEAGSRLLASAASRETLRSIERAFSAGGIRVGLLSPATLVLFDGFDPLLSAAAGGDYLLLHRAGGTTSLLIAREGKPLFFRQKLAREEESDDEQEIRLSLSYYSENLGGGALKSMFFHDEDATGRPLWQPPGLDARPLSSVLLHADESLDAQAANSPELWSALAAVSEAA
jgi:hypothetical protein